MACALVGLGALAACDVPPNLGVAFHVEQPLEGRDPLAGALEACVVLEGADGDAVRERCAALGDPPAFPSLGALPFGQGYRVRVETISRVGSVIGRGRSYRFDVSPDGLSGSPDVLLGVVGTFGRLEEEPPWELPPVSLTRAPGGALVAISDGTVWRYDAHPTDPTSPRWTRASRSSERAGARYAAFDDGYLLAVGGAEVGASLYDDRGRVVALLDDPVLEEHRYGATVVIAPGSSDALVYGGTDTIGGAPFVAVTRIRRLDGSGLRAEIDPRPLSVPRKDASPALLTDIGDQAQPSPVALILGGSSPGEVAVVNPVINVPPPLRFDLVPPAVPVEATVGVLARDLALVVGGGPSAEDPEAGRRLRVLTVDPADGRPREVRRLTPFARARRRPAVALFGDGLALIVGGLDEAEVPVASAQVVFAGRFTIDVEDTGSTPLPLGGPLATTMEDGTVLVVDPALVAAWFPSRQRGF